MQKQLIFQNKKKFANLISSMFPRVLFYISKEELYLKTSSTHV
jgi:hypothetical protein